MGRTKGIAKFGGTLIILFVAASFLQGRGLIPTAGGLGSSLQSFLNNAKGAESGLETITPTNAPLLVEDLPPASGTSGTGGTGGGFSIDPGSVFKQSGFKGLLEQFTQSPGNIGIFSQPLSVSVRKGLNLSVLGVSGIETQGLSILGKKISLAIQPKVKSFSQPTLIGSFTTPTGGTRVLRAQPKVFKRLQQSLGI